ncbi:phospholipase D family protein [Stenotrophomonas rhizophila]|uniref:phospholipase D family protein n=1 Tax=Stenotrophomonas rhizophila TaxID=216778 RepID=UPI001E408723|nr:phospholipase D family protein [Stenotrophomonas rhizophila]MCC7632754.1 phospholipase D family protein [Stenotrophomonas rhizophila]MCC7662521.1 phospholipase D family protein [Stenotrophomonas rhizophila]
MTERKPLWRRMLRWLGIFLAVLALLVLSGLLLADHLTPQARGPHSSVLPPQPAQTAIDRELVRLQADHPDQSGVAFLSDGLDAYAARALITRHAGRSLDLQYYLWHDDLIGHLMARELHQAAERSVRVRILLDDMNAQDKDALMMALDEHPNIEIRLYNPFRNRNGLWRLVEMVQRVFSVNHRMHNKSWIADGRVAIVGGRNIGEEYFSARPDVNFRDLDLLVAGKAVQQANVIFDDYWNSQAAVPISALAFQTPAQLRLLVRQSANEAKLDAAQPYLRRVQAQAARSFYRDAPGLHWSDRVEIVSDPAMKHRRDDQANWLVTRLVGELASTRYKALLISPYFVPGQEGSEGMAAMVQRGATVGVVTNSLAANDVAAVHSGYMRYREPLLRSGVHLYELKARGHGDSGGLFGSSGASLHTKAFVLDDARGFVGSFNLDPRSAYLNTEMGVLFDDPVLAARLRGEYLRLASPQVSYWVALDGQGRLRWLDRDSRPLGWLTHEPDSALWQRASARVISWLPLESQL